MTEQQDDDQERRDFASFLVEHDKGRPNSKATEELAAVAAAVLKTGKRGTVTCTVNLTRRGGTELDIAVAVTTKAPQADPRNSTWFSDEHGNLRRDRDPRQFALIEED